MMFRQVSAAVTLVLLATQAYAERKLYSNSLVNCMKNNTDIIPDYFNVVFDAEARSINYDISLTATLNGKLKAAATVYAFGFDVIHETIDLCKLNMKQFCPITPSHIEVQSVQYIDKSYVDKIPGIAYTFPDLDAVARLIILNQENEILGCLQASFNNGKTVAHEGVKWATAVIAGLGLLVSALLSIFGNSASASRMSAVAMSLFTYFQSVVVIGMVAVEDTPPIASAWCENLAWSMGLIRTEFMQKIFRWYVQATGGTPTQYLTSSTKEILTQRSLDDAVVPFAKPSSFLSSTLDFLFPALKSVNTNELVARNSKDQDPRYFIPITHISSNDYLTILRGIKRIGYDSDIEPTSVVCTGFTFFFLCLYVLIAVYLFYRFMNERLTRTDRRNWLNKNLETRTNYIPVFKGMLLRYIFIGFPQLTILSMWEFTRNDSGAVVTVAVFFLILALSSMAVSCYQVLRFGKQSIVEHGNPAAILYGSSDVLSRYGFLYTVLNASKYWFCAVTLIHIFIKAIFVGLAQSSGKTQAMAIWIFDMIYLGLLCHFLPYMDRFTNVLFVFIQLINTINAFLFTFFSGIYNQEFRVSSVMGLIFFIMNAAVSLLLLLIILGLALFTIFSKNPDAKFSPTKDDRTSFQKKHQSIVPNFDDSNELLALGAVAKEHGENWENDLYKLQENLKHNSGDEFTTSHHQDTSSDEAVGGFAGFLSRAKSLTRGKSLLKKKTNEPSLEDHPLPPAPVSDDSNVDLHHNQNSSGELHSDPFQSHTENPFVSDEVFEHKRIGSRLSAMTNGTGGGLSVFGERINPADYESSIDEYPKTSRLSQSNATHPNRFRDSMHEEEESNDIDDMNEEDEEDEDDDSYLDTSGAHRRI